jgi:hypothetical protein
MPKRCPFCKESLREEAVFCRYCNHDLEDAEYLRSRVRVRTMALALFALFGLGVLFTLLNAFR